MSSLRSFLGRRGIAAWLVFGLAALLLVGAVLVWLNVLRTDEPSPAAAPHSREPSPGESAAPASPDVVPTAEATATPTAEPTAPPEVAYGEAFAVTVLVDQLNVREEPVSGAVVAALSAGDFLGLDGEPETHDGVTWYRIWRIPDLGGWVSGGPTGSPYVEIHRRVEVQAPASIEGMSGAGPGYLAWGIGAGPVSATRPRFAAASADGVTWRVAQLPEAMTEAATVVGAHGPAGWLLAASNDDNTATGGLWRSADGLSWEAVPTQLGAALVPQRMVGGASGYVLGLRDDRTGSSRAAVFRSADGRSWQEVETDVDVFDIGMATAGDGFALWTEDPGAGTWIRYSPDGITWYDTSDGGRLPSPSDAAASLAVIGGRFVATTIEQPGGPLKVWTATLPSESDPAWPALEWQRQTAAEAQLDTGGLELVSLGDRIIGLGRSWDSGGLVTWSTVDGVTWQPQTVGGLDANGRIGPLAAGRAGLVVVGYDPTSAGYNPRFWRTVDGSAWEPEPVRAVASLDSAVIGACPDLPATMMEWLAIPGAVAAECFGDQPITFRAWNTVGGGCGGFAPGVFEPSWLASPFAMLGIVLTPYEAEYGGCGSGIAHPDLAVPEPQQWVEVTGHFADPAAPSCRARPDPTYGGAGGQGTLAFECRTRFVITQMRPVP